ncbi:MAG: LacI family DNA-binding transcriptional regulator [Acidobacteriota bacterium]|nr:LacI family DNA-binding transcriptional regulator [Acidobacteriota bacterium]
MKPVNIKDIAKALDVSIGTVDRALHGRSDVSPSTRARVLKKAKELGYRPNFAARSLKLNRRIRIGVYFPTEIASFFDLLRAGVTAASSAFVGVNVELVFRNFPRLGKGDLELIEADRNEHFDGILIAPGNPDRIGPTINQLVQHGITVVCVASDAPRTGRLSAVTVDANVSGAIAAELFSRTISHSGHLATITGDLTTLDHAEKLKGFAASLALFAPHLSLVPAVESHEKPTLAYRQAMSLLARKPYPAGIYVSTANSKPVLQALEEKRLLNQIQVITTDLYPELVSYIESGKVLATLFQRPFTQGRKALEILLRYLIDGTQPVAPTRFTPHIVLRSNLPLFTDYLAGQPDSLS